MSKNSKARRDKRKAIQAKKNNKDAALRPQTKITISSDLRDVMKLQEKMDDLFDPNKLTTPKNIDENLISFSKKICGSDPFYIPVKPELWSRQSCCDLNVKEYIRLHGGEIVCGYKLWYNNPIYIEAERHAVLLKDGEYLDVTFNADGEDKILFVVDKPGFCENLDSNVGKIRWGANQDIQLIIDMQEHFESQRNYSKMSDDLAWNTMITYQQWQDGVRMPSIIPVT